MKRLLMLMVLAIVGCAAVTDRGRPGDEQSEAWSEPAPSCEPVPVPCPGGVIEGDIHLEEDCASLTDCEVRGHVTIGRPPIRTRAMDPEESRSPTHVADCRAVATKGARLERVTVHGPPGRVAVYVAPCVSYSRIQNNTLISHGQGGPTLYLGAESTHSVIRGNVIDARDSAREAIAIDASDHNTIRGNTIRGGMLSAYRNCGESGVTRVTTPSDNQIVSNDFSGVLVNVALSSRDGNRGFCDLDDGLADIGSAQSNLDWARRNRVHGNSGGITFQGFSASDNWGNDLP